MDSERDLAENVRHHVAQDENDATYFDEKTYSIPTPRFYKTRRFWIIFGAVTAVLLAIFLPLTFLVFIPMANQNVVTSSTINIKDANVTSGKDGSIGMSMNAQIDNTGSFDGVMEFPEPVRVSFDGKEFARFANVPPVNVSGGSGTFLSNSALEVTDQDAFKEFTKKLIVSDKVNWHLSSTVSLKAEGKEPKSIPMEKDVDIIGYNGLNNITISSFQMPGNDTQGGIGMRLSADLFSESPVSLLLGNVLMNVTYNNINLGSLQMNDLFVRQGMNAFNISGSLVPQANPADLEQVGAFMSDILAGRRVVTTAIATSAPSNLTSNQPAWMTDTINGLRMNLGLQSPKPLEIISNITLDYMRMAFHPDEPYVPTTSTDAIKAIVTVPFGFTIDISKVRQNITVSKDNIPLATINSDWGNAHNDTNIKRVVISLPESDFKVLSGKEQDFTDFVTELTLEDEAVVNLAGNATGIAKTPIGEVTLRDLPFNSNITLYGLQGLKNPPPKVNGLDVVAGTKKGLKLKIDTDLENPSNLEIAMGSDVRMEMVYEGKDLSEVVLPDLTLQIGKTKVKAESIFDPKASSEGMKLLESFLMGEDNKISIKGTKHATDVEPLNPGLEQIKVGTKLPGLGEKLLKSAKLIILPETPRTKVAKSIVEVNNPFSATLNLFKIKALITNFGIPVGTINVEKSGSEIELPGKKVTETTLPLTMNMEISAIIGILRKNAIRAGLDVRPLDELLKLGGIPINGGGNDRRLAKRGIFDGFNIVEFTKKALGHIKVYVDMEIGTRIDDYSMSIHYEQTNVDAYTDDSIAILIPLIGLPIIQAIINRSVLSIDFTIIQDPANSKFKAKMKGAVREAGPVDALIHFNEPLNIIWNGKTIGAVTMPDLKVVGGQGADIDLVADVAVVDGAALEEFSKQLIAQPSFDWALESNNLRVDAVGASFAGVKMQKKVTLKGMDGLKEGAKIEEFKITGADAEGLIIQSVAALPSPSDIGLTAKVMRFKLFFLNTEIGYLLANDQVLLPEATSRLSMTGRLRPGIPIDILSKLFGAYLTNRPVPLQVVGEEAIGPEGRVDWLSNALKTLKLTVILNGIDKFQMIKEITIQDFKMVLEKGKTPQGSSQHTLVKYQVPFPIEVNVNRLSQNVNIVYNGVNVTGFALKDQPVTSTPIPGGGTIDFNWAAELPVQSQEGFKAFLADVTAKDEVQFHLSGSSGVLATTPSGQLMLSPIPIEVDTKMKGLGGLKNPPPQQSGEVKLGGGKFTFNGCSGANGANLGLPITVYNPSSITVEMGDVYFKTEWDSVLLKGKYIVGPTMIEKMKLQPGANAVTTKFFMCGVWDSRMNNISVQASFLREFASTGVQLRAFGYNDYPAHPSTDNPLLVDAITKVDLPILVKHRGLNLLALNLTSSSVLPSSTANISSTVASSSSGTPIPSVTETSIPPTSDVPTSQPQPSKPTTKQESSTTEKPEKPTDDKKPPTPTETTTPPKNTTDPTPNKPPADDKGNGKEGGKEGGRDQGKDDKNAGKDKEKAPGAQALGFEQKTSYATQNSWSQALMLSFFCSLVMPFLLFA
ncbi:uncharacterized protein VTP21DRAFT_10214 [Calcarisporiella thermophila]|uniref:uncharacterized protein n=1 Tax=Calcarisporiella thermophila TaxID=911321 RepID=UPI003743DAF2